MKKLVFILSFLLVGFFMPTIKAQVSVGAGFGVYKSFAENSDGLLGFNIGAKFYITENMRAGVNFGYYGKTTTIFNTKIRSFIMPIVGSFEFILLDSQLAPYVGIDAGIYSMGASSSGNTNSKAYFGAAPVLGVDFSLTDKLLLNANLKYHFLPKENLKDGFGFNIGIAYKI